MRTRAWLILRLKGTNKVLVLKRSKCSRNKKQWDFIGGSTNRKRVNPRNLIRKESSEEIGFTPPYLVTKLVVVAKFSIYHYFISSISNKELENIQLSHEHTHYKLININKLRLLKNTHHSIRIFLKN